jgi:hypothetical protein
VGFYFFPTLPPILYLEVLDATAVEETTPFPALTPTRTPLVDAAGRPLDGAIDFDVFGFPAMLFYFKL